MLIASEAASQTVINGKITDIRGKPVADASVMLMLPTDSTIVAYNFSNVGGDYTIRYDGKQPELLLTVYGFNVQRQIKRIFNKSQRLDFTISEGAINLKEFTVKSEKIWGGRDTVNYIVDAFRDTTDIVIADVLRKMPGIEVEESGQIKYRGKAIKKFYIENMDMLQGRYGVATNNVSASDIATVQVFENHQPINALQDVAFSDDAAINLKLKEGAKGIYSFMANTGGGYDNGFLWNEGITGMFFGKTRQHLAMYKTNNTGEDLSGELQSFTEENTGNSAPLAYMVAPSPPDIPKQRYYFNNTHGVSVSTLYKLKDSTEFSFTLNGMRDTENRNSRTKTTFILPGADTLSISELMASEANVDKLDCDFGLMRNGSLNYLRSFVNLSGDWQNTTGSVFNNNTLEQTYKLNTLRAVNSIHWVRRGKDKGRWGTELNSRTWFQSQPGQLQVTPGVFSDVLNDSLPYAAVNQDVVMNSFETRNSLMFLSSVVWNSIRIHPAFFFSLQQQSLKTHLLKSLSGEELIQIPGDSLANELDWLRSKAGVSINITYQRRDFNAELSTPLQHQFISLSDAGTGEDSHRHTLLFQPFVRLRYSFTTRWELSGSWFYYNRNPDLNTLYSGYVVQNYRTLNRYESKLSDSYGSNAILKLAYKDIMQFLFTSLEFNYNCYNGEVMYAQEFVGSVMKTTLVEMPNNGNYLSLTGRASKGFDWKKLSFNFEGSLGIGSTPQLRQGKLIQYESRGLNANLTGSMALTNAILIANKCSWSHVTGNTGQGEQLAAISNFIDAASVDIIFSPALFLSASFEYYSTQNSDRRQNFYLIDAGLTYSWKHVRFSLDWSNVLNTKNYVYSYYSSMNSYYSEYTIRPAAVILKAQFKLY